MIAARKYGEVRFAIASAGDVSLSKILAKFGLRTEEASLIECDRATAQAILTHLLWKDMAYEGECMPQEQAVDYAASLFDEVDPSAKYYSNGNVVAGESWNPLTESTFDAGIICVESTGRSICIWFQDED